MSEHRTTVAPTEDTASRPAPQSFRRSEPALAETLVGSCGKAIRSRLDTD